MAQNKGIAGRSQSKARFANLLGQQTGCPVIVKSASNKPEIEDLEEVDPDEVGEDGIEEGEGDETELNGSLEIPDEDEEIENQQGNDPQNNGANGVEELTIMNKKILKNVKKIIAQNDTLIALLQAESKNPSKKSKKEVEEVEEVEEEVDEKPSKKKHSHKEKEEKAPKKSSKKEEESDTSEFKLVRKHGTVSKVKGYPLKMLGDEPGEGLKLSKNAELEKIKSAKAIKKCEISGNLPDEGMWTIVYDKENCWLVEASVVDVKD